MIQPQHPAHEGRFLEAILKAEREVASRPRSVSRAREVRDRASEPEAAPEPSAERAQNRHGGAPRGAVPVARDGPRFANVASRDYARDRIKDTASRRSAIPSVGDRKLRSKKENPDVERAGTEETGLFDKVNRK